MQDVKWICLQNGIGYFYDYFFTWKSAHTTIFRIIYLTYLAPNQLYFLFTARKMDHNYISHKLHKWYRFKIIFYQVYVSELSHNLFFDTIKWGVVSRNTAPMLIQ